MQNEIGSRFKNNYKKSGASSSVDGRLKRAQQRIADRRASRTKEFAKSRNIGTSESRMEPEKGKQGKLLQSDARQMVINVHKFCTEEYDALKVGKPTISVADITGRTAAATGVSRRTVYRILDEKKKSDVAGCVLSTPGKKRPCRTPTKTVVDSFSASAIRTVYSLYRTHFLPSLNDIREALKEADLFHGMDEVVDRLCNNLEDSDNDEEEEDCSEEGNSATASSSSNIPGICPLPPSP
ncbi:hypothetical protein C0J52_10283 [Blattella germanica]|nr:hypothetical protein C0J52_10283 [Blattella germanica]